MVDHFALAPDRMGEAVRRLHVVLSANATHAISSPTRGVAMDLDLVDHLGMTVDIETIVRPGMDLRAELRPHRIPGRIARLEDLVSRSRHLRIPQPLDYLLDPEVHL